MGELVKVLMDDLGVVRSATSPLTAVEVDAITKTFGNLPPQPPRRGDAPGGTGIREPRRPRPNTPSSGAALPPADT
jgi:hypothetical protein